MYIEILITAGIAFAAVYLLYKSISKKAVGNCDSCSGGNGNSTSHCSSCPVEKTEKK